MNLNQSISSICGGHITSPHNDDYIVHTFGGAIVVFSNGTGAALKQSEAANAAAEEAADALSVAERELAAKKAAVAAVEKELAGLNADMAVRYLWNFLPVLQCIFQHLRMYIRNIGVVIL
jgi:hypothetical protein